MSEVGSLSAAALVSGAAGTSLAEEAAAMMYITCPRREDWRRAPVPNFSAATAYAFAQ